MTSAALRAEEERLDKIKAVMIEALLLEELDGEELIRLDDNLTRLVDGIRWIINSSSISPKFMEDEKIPLLQRTTGYHPDHQVVDIKGQIFSLSSRFGVSRRPALKFAEEQIPQIRISNWADGWFALLNPAEDKYIESIESLRREFTSAGNYFQNSIVDECAPDSLRRTKRSKAFWKHLSKIQPGGIVIVPIQLGKRHRTRSTRRAEATFKDSEFGLGLVEGLTIKLTHPHIAKEGYIELDLPGDICIDKFDRKMIRRPTICERKGSMMVRSEPEDQYGERNGPASVLMPREFMSGFTW